MKHQLTAQTANRFAENALGNDSSVKSSRSIAAKDARVVASSKQPPA